MNASSEGPFEVHCQWKHLQYAETSHFTEVYGFAGSQGKVNLHGVLMIPIHRPSRTLVVLSHPTTSVEFLPVPQELSRCGAHVLCAGNRYFRNDTPLIMEKAVADLGAWIRHARDEWGYRKIVLLGWSGGGPLSLFYQAQATCPTVVQTPAGDPYDLTRLNLQPADAIIFQAANVSRAALLSQWLDPSVIDEDNPDLRLRELDIYDEENPNQPPYSQDFIAHYRAEQLKRMRRRTEWVKASLDRLRRTGGKEQERGFVTHRTMADLRFMDPSVDPNGRRPRWSHLGDPQFSNVGPAGLGRFSTLRSWLSQWSVDDSNVNGPAAAKSITSPMLVIENSADDACPASDPRSVFDAATMADKTFEVIEGATHYYQGQPKLMTLANRLTLDWLARRDLIEA